MSKAYCPRCEEYRTDTGEDAWGFIWFAGAPVCMRCQSIVDFSSNGQEEETEYVDDVEEEN
jgi:hypothetical protein